VKALHQAYPIRISKVLTDNGTEFTDWLLGSKAGAPTSEHEFDVLCQSLGIEHRLTPPKRPPTNGMVERLTPMQVMTHWCHEKLGLFHRPPRCANRL
jgi:transposase InsO family protein